MSRDNRVVWVDLLRGMAVFAIVLGHTLRNATAVYPWLYCFHVPLCVMVSGIVFSRSIKPFGKYLFDKFMRLMIPYYVFALVSIFLYEIMGSWMEDAVDGGYSVSLFQNLYGMVYANAGNGLMRWNMPLWYIPMIFVVYVLAQWVYYKNTPQWNYAVFLFSSVIAFVLKSYINLDGLPFGIETAIYLFPFFAIGRVIGCCRNIFERVPTQIKLGIAVILITTGTFMSMRNSLVSYNADNYGSKGYAYFVVQGAMMCIGFVWLASVVRTNRKAIRYLGENTLGIMVMHKFPVLFFVSLLPITKNLINRRPLLGAILVAAVSIILCLVVSTVIFRICPLILGVRKKKSQ